MEEVRGTDVLDAVRRQIPDDARIYNLAEVFKVFGDPTRTKILSLPVRARPVCGGDRRSARMSVSAVSHQLRILRGAKLVKGEKQGKEVLYTLDDDHVTQIMECGLTHIDERD